VDVDDSDCLPGALAALFQVFWHTADVLCDSLCGTGRGGLPHKFDRVMWQASPVYVAAGLFYPPTAQAMRPSGKRPHGRPRGGSQAARPAEPQPAAPVRRPTLATELQQAAHQPGQTRIAFGLPPTAGTGPPQEANSQDDGAMLEGAPSSRAAALSLAAQSQVLLQLRSTSLSGDHGSEARFVC
jgi:hypothetical protein